MNRKLAITVAVLGIAVEIVALYLLGQKRITTGAAVPIIIAGMFLGFVPIFVVARRARRR
jgi:pilus assembly protein TadC